MKKESKPEEIEAYIRAAPKSVQGMLRELRAVIKKTAPQALEYISYGMPYYDYKGRLAYFAPAKKHIGLYIPPPIIQQHKKELENYETTVSAIHLPLDKKIPTSLVRKLIKARMKHNEKSLK